MNNQAEASAILAPHRWTRPSSYYGAIWPEYYVIGGRHRDSDVLEQSNFEVTKQRLAPWADTEINASDFAWTTAAANHWAVGWVEHIYVHEDAPTELLAAAADIITQVADYPVLDEEDYSRREMEAAEDNC